MPDHPEDRIASADEIGGILTAAAFPSPPKIAFRLLELCGSFTAGSREIAETIESDPALAAMLIRMANTVHYGAGIPVTNIQAATVRLGTDKIKSVALAFEIAGLAGEVAGDHFDFEAYWQGCVARGCLGRAVALTCNRRLAGEAFLVGLLQDLCMPVLAEVAPEPYAKLLEESGGCRLRLATLETQLFKFNHIHMVTRLFKQWNMPALLADAIGRHHARPPMQRTADPALCLWQIAYFVGALPLGEEREPTFYDASLTDVLHEAFGISGTAEAEMFRQACQEFRDIEELFRPYIGRKVSAADLMAQAAALLGVATSWSGPIEADPAPRQTDRPADRLLTTPHELQAAKTAWAYETL